MISDDLRSARPEDIECLAQLWFNAWRDGHADVVPEELVRARTLDTFRDRLRSGLTAVRVFSRNDELCGFYVVKQDELDQIFVTARARGTGVAASLITAAENELANAGVQTAWLACAIGNSRAARFYEKHGWRNVGIVTQRLDLGDREFSLDVWRFEKRLARISHRERG